MAALSTRHSEYRPLLTWANPQHLSLSLLQVWLTSLEYLRIGRQSSSPITQPKSPLHAMRPASFFARERARQKRADLVRPAPPPAWTSHGKDMGIEQAFDFLVNLLLRRRATTSGPASLFDYVFFPPSAVDHRIEPDFIGTRGQARRVSGHKRYTRLKDAALDMHNMGQPTNIPVSEYQRARCNVLASTNTV
jgi:hypothetical protein